MSQPAYLPPNLRTRTGRVHLANSTGTGLRCASASSGVFYTDTQESVDCRRCLLVILTDHREALAMNAPPVGHDRPALRPQPQPEPEPESQPAADAEEPPATPATYRVELSRIGPLVADRDRVFNVNGTARPVADYTAAALPDVDHGLAHLLADAVSTHVQVTLALGLGDSVTETYGAGPAVRLDWQRPEPRSHAVAEANLLLGRQEQESGRLSLYRMHRDILPPCVCGHPALCHPASYVHGGNCWDLDHIRVNRSVHNAERNCHCDIYWPQVTAADRFRLLRDHARDADVISHGAARMIAAAQVNNGLPDRAYSRPFITTGEIPAAPRGLWDALYLHVDLDQVPERATLAHALEHYLDHHGPRGAVPGWHDVWA